MFGMFALVFTSSRVLGSLCSNKSISCTSNFMMIVLVVC